MNTLALAVAASAWLADGVLERVASVRKALAARDTSGIAGLSDTWGLGLVCTGVLGAAGVGASLATLLVGEVWRAAGLECGYIAALVGLGLIGRTSMKPKLDSGIRGMAALALVAATTAILLLAAVGQGIHGSLALAALGTVFALLLAALRALRARADTGVPSWRSALVAAIAALVLDGMLRPWGAS